MKRAILFTLSLTLFSCVSSNTQNTDRLPNQVGDVGGKDFQLELHDCVFDGVSTEFIPTSSLTQLLKSKVKNSTVYKVKYKRGSIQVGPKDYLAVFDMLPSKNIVVSFIDSIDDKINYSNVQISIALDSPVSIDKPLIGFKANLNDENSTEGVCKLSY